MLVINKTIKIQLIAPINANPKVGTNLRNEIESQPFEPLTWPNSYQSVGFESNSQNN